MDRLKIDAEELIMALESHNGEVEYFLDLQSGEVVFVADELVGEPDDEIRSAIAADPDRFDHQQRLRRGLTRPPPFLSLLVGPQTHYGPP